MRPINTEVVLPIIDGYWEKNGPETDNGSMQIISLEKFSSPFDPSRLTQTPYVFVLKKVKM